MRHAAGPGAVPGARYRGRPGWRLSVAVARAQGWCAVSVSAQAAIRAWINALPIVGDSLALARGAYLTEQRSVADGAYVVVSRTPEGVTNVVAEDGAVGLARIQCLVYAGTQEASEAAGKALRAAFETLTGCPSKCGNTGVTIMVADNYLGPFLIPVAPDAGETYAHQVNADFLLTEAI